MYLVRRPYSRKRYNGVGRPEAGDTERCTDGRNTEFTDQTEQAIIVRIPGLEREFYGPRTQSFLAITTVLTTSIACYGYTLRA
jgi:hypothetical protein